MGDVVQVDFRRKARVEEPKLLDFGDDPEFIKGVEVGQIWAHLRYYGQSGHSGLMAAKMLGEQLICHATNLPILLQIAELKGLSLVVGMEHDKAKFMVVVFSAKPQGGPKIG